MVILIWLLTYFVGEVIPGFIILAIKYGWNIDAITGLIFVAAKYDIHSYLPLAIDIAFVLIHSALFAILMSKWFEYQNKRRFAKGKLGGVYAMYPKCTKGGKFRIFFIHGIAFFADCALLAFSDALYASTGRGSAANVSGSFPIAFVFLALVAVHIVGLRIATKVHQEELSDRQEHFNKLVKEAQERLRAKEAEQKQ